MKSPTERVAAPLRQPMIVLPAATGMLLLANLAVHGLRVLLPARLDDAVVAIFGFLPLRYHGWDWLSWPALVSPITYQFLHGGFIHLGVNMLALLAFGAGVEQRLGPWRYLAFYLLCGIAAAFAQFAVDPGAPDVLIGASGALSGLFAAVIWFRVARRGFWPIVILWIVINAIAGETGLGAAGIGPVAWLAHLGGFTTGLVLFPLFDRRPPRPA